MEISEGENSDGLQIDNKNFKNSKILVADDQVINLEALKLNM